MKDMKTPFYYSLALALTATPLSKAGEKNKGSNFAEKTVVVQQECFAFPAKSSEIIKATFLVGPPDITIDPGLAFKMGGLAINELVRAPIENLLHNSGRFRVSNKPGPYSVSANLSDFSISQTSDKKNVALNKFFKEIINKTAKIEADDPLKGVLAAALDADWSKDELQMEVSCAVTIQLRDHEGLLLAGQTAQVTRRGTTKNIRTELAGIQFSTGATREPLPLINAPPGNLAGSQFQSRIIELATFQALLQLIPILDAKLAEGVITRIPVPAPGISQVANPGTARTEFSPDDNSARPVAFTKAAFCSKCGTKAGEADNFCTKCGNKLTP